MMVVVVGGDGKVPRGPIMMMMMMMMMAMVLGWDSKWDNDDNCHEDENNDDDDDDDTTTKKTVFTVTMTITNILCLQLEEEKVRGAKDNGKTFDDDNDDDDHDGEDGDDNDDQFTAGRGKSPGGLFKGAENLLSLRVSYSPIR